MLLGHTSLEPEICCCCCRPAIPVGVIAAPGAVSVMWLCDFCNTTIGLKVIDMKKNELHAIEKQAIADALKAAPVDLVGVVLRCLVDHGVNDLGALNAGNYNSVREIVTTDDRFVGAIETLFLTYTQQVRRALINSNGA